MPRDPRQWDLTKGASKLNEHRDEVIDLFREGLSLAKIGARYGMVASGVMKWLRAAGEYDRVADCLLPECSERFTFRPRKLYCTNLHARRANARERYNKDQPKNKARSAVTQAVSKGQLVRSEICERCEVRPGYGKDGRTLIRADHHHGYDQAHELDVWWLCSRCDHEVEGLRKREIVVTREHPCLGGGKKPLTTQALTLKGETKQLIEWARENNISRKTLLSRLEQDWDRERAVTEPMRHQSRGHIH